MNINNVLGGAVLTGAGFAAGYGVLNAKFNDLLAKSVHVEVADNAPANVKLLLSQLDLSVKVQDIYDAALGKKPSPVSGYLKVTLR